VINGHLPYWNMLITFHMTLSCFWSNGSMITSLQQFSPMYINICYQLSLTVPFLHALLQRDVSPGQPALKTLGHKHHTYRSPANRNWVSLTRTKIKITSQTGNLQYGTKMCTLYIIIIMHLHCNYRSHHPIVTLFHIQQAPDWFKVLPRQYAENWIR
jgi:hypothetical protein